MNPLEPEWLSFLILISWFVWDGFKHTLGCEPGCPTKGGFWSSAGRGAKWFRGHVFLQRPADDVCTNPCMVPCWGLVFGLCPTHLLCCSLHNSPVHISFGSSLLSLCLCSRSMRNKLFCVAGFSKCFLLPQLTQTSPPPSVPCELRLLVHKHLAFPNPQFSSLANSLLPGALCLEQEGLPILPFPLLTPCADTGHGSFLLEVELLAQLAALCLTLSHSGER